jgi:AraC-like ligand binding domain
MTETTRAVPGHGRRKALNVYDAAKECRGSHDEWPVFPRGTDPMPYVNRYSVAMPFFLAGEKDQLVIVMAGRARVHLAGDNPTHLDLELGDFCYLPAGQPHRLVPDEEVIHVRYKAEPAGFEAAIWYCAGCGRELFAHEFDAVVSATSRYLDACDIYNASETVRTCNACSAVGAPVSLDGIAWSALPGREDAG